MEVRVGTADANREAIEQNQTRTSLESQSLREYLLPFNDLQKGIFLPLVTPV